MNLAKTWYKTHNSKLLAIIENMSTQFKTLQAQSLYTYQLQEPLLLYEYKKLKLLLLGSGALQVSFSDWLLSRQAGWGCRCTISFFLEKQRWKRKALNWKHLNSSLFIVPTNECHLIKSIHFLKAITFASSPYMRNARAFTALPILKHLPIGASQQKLLPS